MPRSEILGPFPPGVDPSAYDEERRRVLWKLPSGLYVIGSRAGDERNLMTANWVTQLALAPKLLGIAVEHAARTHELIRRGRVFSVSILARADRVLVRRFVKPTEHDAAATTLAGVEYRDTRVTGSPLVAAAIGYLDCALHSELDCGSHTLFVGEIVDAGLADGGAEAEVLRMEDTRMSYGG